MAFNLKELYKLPDEKIERTYFSFIWLIRILLIAALVLEAYYQRIEFFFVTGLALILTLVPILFEKRYKIKVPPGLHLFIVLFIYAGIYLGEVKDFYYRFFWWDTVLHTLAGFALALVGFSVILLLYKTQKIKANPQLIAFFAFCFSTTLSVLWEIFEFSMDIIFKLNMQKVHIGTGVTDTMIDLSVNMIGALIASIMGYFYLKKGKSDIYSKFINYLINKNPRLFKKK
jgi:uncharacterized membrane protein YjdF